MVEADVIVIDEIGPMELFSQPFKSSVMDAVRSEKAILATIHYRARDRFVENIRNTEDAEINEVTFRNRDRMPNLMVEKMIDAAKKQSSSRA